MFLILKSINVKSIMNSGKIIGFKNYPTQFKELNFLYKLDENFLTCS